MRLRFNEPAQIGGQRFFVAGQFLVHQHEIGLQSTQMPKGVRGQNFAHHFDVADVTDHDDDNRQVAGNALPPESALTLPAAAETRGWRSQLSLREKDVCRQLLESLNISRADVEPAHLKLGMSPRSLEGTRARVKLRVAFGEPNDGFARLRGHRDQRKLKSLVRQDRDIPTQAEDRIEHGPDPAR